MRKPAGSAVNRKTMPEIRREEGCTVKKRSNSQKAVGLEYCVAPVQLCVDMKTLRKTGGEEQ